MELSWPEHPNFPSYGYTITRFDLDAMVGRRISLDEINDGYRGMLEGSVARTVVTR